VAGPARLPGQQQQHSKPQQREKYQYQRPHFLNFRTSDEVQVTADHAVRPIIVPRDLSALPWAAGYAETINAGKSRHNEDQAMARQGSLGVVAGGRLRQLPYTVFAVFDGHAGAATAVTASNDLWAAVEARLESVAGQLVSQEPAARWFSRPISSESLIIGALESAFWDADQAIGEEKRVYSMPGGCTVVLALFILGKLYVANAGDSRGVLCRAGKAYPMSHDFTPVTERSRLLQLGKQLPHLLAEEYTWLEYSRRPLRKDIGSRMLYRDAHMTGWAYKIIQESDMKFPMVFGEGKRSRLLATIGVTRGLGDHELRAQAQHGTVLIKPFLSPQPEVRVLDIDTETVTPEDVLVLATDGLWDVVTNEEVASIVARGLQAWDNESKAGKFRFVSLAQDLVMAARGKLKDKNWRRSNGDPATIDDITVIVIPILPYKLQLSKEDENTSDVSDKAQEEEVELEVHFEDSKISTGFEAMEVEKETDDPEFSNTHIEIEVQNEDPQSVT